MDRTISSSELQMLDPGELSALFAEASREASLHDSGTPERRNALASMENIRRALIAKQFTPPRF